MLIKSTVQSCIQQLVQVDGLKTCHLYAQFWPKEHQSVLDQLQEHPELQYRYLQGLVDSFSPSEEPMSIPAHLVPFFDQYIRLKCSLDPDNVTLYLTRVHQHFTSLPFSLDSVLELCKQAKIRDAQIWILEKSGNYAGALDLLLADLSLYTSVQDHLPSSDQSLAVTNAQDADQTASSTQQNSELTNQTTPHKTTQDLSRVTDQTTPHKTTQDLSRVTYQTTPHKTTQELLDLAHQAISTCIKAGHFLDKQDLVQLWLTLIRILNHY